VWGRGTVLPCRVSFSRRPDSGDELDTPLEICPTPRRSTVPHVLAAALLALLFLVPAQAASSAAAAVEWTSPTKADRTEFRIVPGKPLVLTLTAKASKPVEALSIEPVRGLPPGATIATDTQGGTARAVFRWKPTEEGDFTLQFVARAGAGVSTPVRTYVISVHEKVDYPQSYGLTNAKTGHWATVVRPVAVRSKPSESGRVVARLGVLTPEETQNLVLVLNGIDMSENQTWYRVRLPILPNNSTGWVPKRALGELTRIDTHLVIDRARLTATLKRKGVTVFTARIGIGESHWPTPRGQFYIRSRLTNFGSAVYGPLAFGTSARSAVLTDWPGGGFVGIHGTNQPEILPGQVSHGCIRLRNPDILRLARLMKVGTPVTIR
jgi:L,D-transpeptidase catalytic domain